jgi:hypothetical protein
MAPLILNPGVKWGEWLVSRFGRFIPRVRGSGAGWVTEQVWTLWRRGRSVALGGNRTTIPRSANS